MARKGQASGMGHRRLFPVGDGKAAERGPLARNRDDRLLSRYGGRLVFSARTRAPPRSVHTGSRGRVWCSLRSVWDFSPPRLSPLRPFPRYARGGRRLQSSGPRGFTTPRANQAPPPRPPFGTAQRGPARSHPAARSGPGARRPSPRRSGSIVRAAGGVVRSERL